MLRGALFKDGLGVLRGGLGYNSDDIRPCANWLTEAIFLSAPDRVSQLNLQHDHFEANLEDRNTT